MSAMDLHAHRRSFLAIVDDMAMMMLAVLDTILLLVELCLEPGHRLVQGIVALDLVIACIFLAEFMVRLFLAADRTLFLRHYSWELLTAVPLSAEVFQGLRILRLLRLSRLVIHIRQLRHGDEESLTEYRITT